MPIPSGCDVAKVEGNHQHWLPSVAYIVDTNNWYIMPTLVCGDAVKVEGNCKGRMSVNPENIYDE